MRIPGLGSARTMSSRRPARRAGARARARLRTGHARLDDGLIRRLRAPPGTDTGIDVAPIDRWSLVRTHRWSEHAHASRTASGQRAASECQEEPRRTRDARDDEGGGDPPSKGGRARARRERARPGARGRSDARRPPLRRFVRSGGDVAPTASRRAQQSRRSRSRCLNAPLRAREVAGQVGRDATKAPPPWVAPARGDEVDVHIGVCCERLNIRGPGSARAGAPSPSRPGRRRRRRWRRSRARGRRQAASRSRGTPSASSCRRCRRRR